MRKTPVLNTRSISFVLASIATVMFFQNCNSPSGGDSSGGGGSASSSSVNGGGGSGTGSGPVTLTAEEKQAYCQQFISTPTLQSMSSSNLTLKIGMGSAITGDVNSADNTISAISGITNKSAFDAESCSAMFNLQIRCEVVEGDTSRPVNITQAFNISGVNVGNGANAATQTNIAKMLYRPENCQRNFMYANMQSNGANSANSQIASNASEVDSYRCAAGSFYIRYTVRANVGNVNRTSAAQYAKVTVQNGCWDPVRLTPSPAPGRLARFGSAVAIDGNWAAIVAQTDPAGAVTRVGSVATFEKVSGVWTFRQKILLPSASQDETIQAIALKGTKLFIGSPFKKGTGAVYHYERSGTDFVLVNEVTRPLSGDATLDAQDQYFGYALAFNGSKLAIGGPHYSDYTYSRMGRVYIYDVSGSTVSLAQTLVHNDSSRANKGFGWSLSMTANNLAVGAPQAATKENLGKGDVLVYGLTSGSFNFIKKLTPTTLNNGAVFGYSVALNGNRLLIGAPWNDKGNSATTPKSGAVYYFADFNTAVVGAPNWQGNANDSLGNSVALGAQGLLIGVPGGNSRSGYVDYYAYANLTNVGYRLYALDTVLTDALGWSVAVSGNDVMVGAAGKNDPLEVAGAGYAFIVK